MARNKKKPGLNELTSASQQRVNDEAGAAPREGDAADLDAFTLDAFRLYGEAAGLVNMIFKDLIKGCTDEASRPEANEPHSHAEIREEMEALKRGLKETQAGIGHLQTMKKLFNGRLKDLRESRKSVRSHSRQR